MAASEDTCPHPEIPERLHTNGRLAVDQIEKTDRLFFWHPALPEGEAYVSAIPGHKRFANQSCNSDELNPDGDPSDVLYNVRDGGGKMSGMQIACIPVEELCNVSSPHPTLVRRDIKTGKPLSPVQKEQIHFVPKHTPTLCMYPHCEIISHRDGMETKDIAKGSRSDVKLQFAKIAERYRLEMAKYSTAKTS